MVEAMFEAAISSVGQTYLDAEQQLIAMGQSAVPFLQQQIVAASPLSALIAQVILEQINGNEFFGACLDFLDEVERKTALSVTGAPPIEWVVGSLRQRFGNRVAPLLGVYAIKLSDVWPSWKLVSSIAYLGNLDNKVSADALIQIAIATPSEYYRDLATTAIFAVGDANSLHKLEAQLRLTDLPDVARAALQQVAEQIRQKLETQV